MFEVEAFAGVNFAVRPVLESLFNMLGGLGLFLFGVREMTQSFVGLSNSLFREMISKVACNKYMAAFVGFAVTAIVQSSSAVTVIIVGLLDAGLLELAQAAAIIMGANVGTTVTPLIMAINLLEFAPLIIFGGVVLEGLNGEAFKAVGSVLIGFGVLFLGMNMISSAARPISTLPVVREFLVSLSNPFIGVLFGVTFTAIMQSSSVSMGLLEALSLAGAISFRNAAFIIYGQNIGTCVTALIASFETRKNAKRAVVIHFLFNLIGAAIFTCLSLMTPFLRVFEAAFAQSVMFKISALHILFNVVSTAILLPFSEVLVKIACKVVSD